MKHATILTLLLIAGTLAAKPAFDLDPYSFREETPGVYRAFGAALCAAPDGGGATLTLRARVAPERCDDHDWAALGIDAYFSPNDYWQLALVKSPDNAASKHKFELKAMARSVWGGEKNIAKRLEYKTFTPWDYGREYDLTLTCSPDRVEGEIRDAESGEPVFKAAYAVLSTASGATPFPEGDAAKLWRPALYVNGRMKGVFTNVEASAGKEGGQTPSALCETPQFPPFRPSGPDTGLFGTATGFFHIETIDGRDWPIDPTGRAVILAGTQHIKPQGTFSDAVGYSPYGRFVATNYPSVDAWVDETLARLDDWGFTMLGNACSLGMLSHRTLPHVRNIQMGQRVSRGDPEWFIREWQYRPCSALPNVFHPDFAAACEWRAREQCAPFKDDPWLIGWFIDNELAWWGASKRIRGTGLYGLVAKLPQTHGARKVLDAFLAERGAAVEEREGMRAPSFEDKVDFLRLYARTYYEKTVSAIRKADPNHMVLGSRYAGLDGANPVVWEEAGKLCDIVTFNCYPWADLDRGIVLDAEGGVPMTERLREYHGYAKAPLMVTEWSFPALDHGHPCLVGAGQRMNTQAERVEATMLFAKTLLADPNVAGYDYFKWNDQPKTGSSRHSPEDCNYGLVNDDGVPYEGITQAFKALHGDLVHWRSAPPPQEKPVATATAVSERARFYAEASGGPGSPAVGFRREADGSWSLSNGLVRLSGRIGTKWLANEIAFEGKRPVGRLNALLAAEEDDRYLWLDTSSLAGVEQERDEATGAVSVLLRGLGGRAAAKSADGTDDATPPETDDRTALSFAITLRVTLLPGRPDALVEIVALENLADKPLAASAVYMRAFSRDKQVARPTSAPNVWKAPKIGTWSLPGGGEWGLISHDDTIRKFRFFVSAKDGVQHPDAAFSPVQDGESFAVAPGETWHPASPMSARLFLRK